MKFNFILTVLVPWQLWAGELQYFENKIDFWGSTATQEKVVSSPAPTMEVKEKFSWKTYLDPKNKEFFKEGDYTPPEPFMEVARNPSDENIKNWFELMKKKNELARRLDLRIQEYLSRNGSRDLGMPTPPVEKAVDSGVATRAAEKTSAEFDPTRFKIRMYFESTCPHCRRMFGVLKRLRDEGVQIETLQMDRGPVPDDEKIVPLGRADPEDVKKHGIKGVPFLLIADLKREVLLPPVQGFQEYGDMLRLLKEASR